MNASKNALTAILAAAVFLTGISIVGVASGAKPLPPPPPPVYVPFQAVTGALEVCDAFPSDGFSDIDKIEIDSQAADGDFIVTSILVVAQAPGGGFIEIRNLKVDEVVNFVVNSGNLIAGIFGPSAFEVLGESTQNGAFLPRQIAASSAGSPDIIVTLACEATTTEITFPAGQIVVSGWKEASDTITVTLVD